MLEITQHPKIWIVVLSWNQYDLTAACVRSLMHLDYPKYQIVVVDNNSQDQTVEKLCLEFGSRLELIANAQNLGFAGGNNVGVRYALHRNADYVMILNNDTIVDAGFLGPLVSLLQAEARAAVVTPKIYFMHDSDRLWAAGGRVYRWLGLARGRGRNQLDRGQYDRREQVDYAPGCCMLFRREALEKVGLLDERYFAYFEDSDWCMRARAEGFQIWYEPSSVIWHIAGASSRTRKAWSASVRYLNVRNNLWFIHRYIKGPPRLVALASVIASRLLLSSVKQIALGRWTHLRSIWQGAYDGFHEKDCRPKSE